MYNKVLINYYFSRAFHSQDSWDVCTWHFFWETICRRFCHLHQRHRKSTRQPEDLLMLWNRGAQLGLNRYQHRLICSIGMGISFAPVSTDISMPHLQSPILVTSIPKTELYRPRSVDYELVHMRTWFRVSL